MRLLPPLLPLLLLVLLLPRPGRAEALKIATWNLDWLTLRPAGDPALPGDVHPRAAADFDRLGRYAAALDADVVALEEVDGAEPAARVFPPARYDILMANGRAVQRVGFALRRGLRWTREPDLAALDLDPDAPRPLRAGADVRIELPNGAPLRLLAVHLKTGCWEGALRASRPACATLRAQLPALAGWIAARQAEGTAFAVLGDFNRRMEPDSSARPDPVLAALDRAAPLLRTTEGRASPCWGGEGFIDHILLGGAARSWLVPDSLRVMAYREDPAWKDRLSDHCAVSVRLAPAGEPGP